MCWGTCSSSTRDTRSLKATACSSGPGWSSIWQQPGESGGRAAVSVAMVLGLLEFGGETRRGALRKPTSRKTMPGFKSGRFAVVMDLVQAAVERGGASELVVGAGGDDATVVHQDDAVGELDRAQAVRDEEGRAALGELFDGLADQGLVLDVHGAGGLVEDQDRGIAKHRPRQGDALALASGKAVPALADDRVVTLGQVMMNWWAYYSGKKDRHQRVTTEHTEG